MPRAVNGGFKSLAMIDVISHSAQNPSMSVMGYYAS